MKTFRLAVLIGGALLASSGQGAPLDAYLNELQAKAQQPFSADRGKAFWSRQHAAPDGGQARSCSLCHSNNLNRTGEHIRTHKSIKPMAPGRNPERLTSTRKVRKWLLRNCKYVLGRTCTAQEQGDVLTFIHGFKAG